MKFRQRILFVAFAVCFMLVAILSLISLLRFSRLSARVAWVEHSYKVGDVIDALQADVIALDNAEFRFLVTRDESYKAAFSKSLQQLSNNAAQLKNLVGDNPQQSATLVLFQSDASLYKAAADSFFAASGPVGAAAWTASERTGNNFISSARAHLNEMAETEQRLLRERSNARDSYQRLTSSMLRALTILFSIFTLVLFYLLLREFGQRLRYQSALQEKLDEAALSKRELEYIAYATSHDLQEPLRKIRVFADRLKYLTKGTLPAESLDSVLRMEQSATHMQELVQELMVLTSLAGSEVLERCPLDKYVREAMDALSGRKEETGASITTGPLPVVNGNPGQLLLLFEKLFDNAIKFSRPGVAPAIRVSATSGEGSALGLSPDDDRRYHCITVMDNGVGFDNSLTEKIFGIFRQLHTDDDGNTGSGTGLAICQRIMSNHHGRITAHGFPGTGATFKLYFPA